MQAMFALNGVITSPRFFSFVMRRTHSRFRPDNIHRLLLSQPPAVTWGGEGSVLLILQWPIVHKVLIPWLMPGVQVRPTGTGNMFQALACSSHLCESAFWTASHILQVTLPL